MKYKIGSFYKRQYDIPFPDGLIIIFKVLEVHANRIRVHVIHNTNGHMKVPYNESIGHNYLHSKTMEVTESEALAKVL